jgi:hypothetical protein
LIDKYAFYDDDNLTSVTFSNTTKTWGLYEEASSYYPTYSSISVTSSSTNALNLSYNYYYYIWKVN